MRKSRKRLIVLCSLGFVCILACGGWFGWQTASDPDRLDYSQNVNPYEPLIPPGLASVLTPRDMEAVMLLSDEIVLARAVGSTYQKTFSFEKDGSMPELEEKTPGNLLYTTREITPMEVVKSFGGSLQAGDSFDFVVYEGFLGGFPQMEPGDTYLLMLEEKEGVGYCAPAFSFSFFYFSEEEKVYPSTDASVYKKYTGMPVGEFERVIRKHWSGRAA